MFIAYEVSIELIHSLRELLPVIKRQDRDLADQIHRAATSVALNIAEEARFTTGNARRHFEIAQGSAMEVKSGLDVADAWGWVVDSAAPRRASIATREQASDRVPGPRCNPRERGPSFAS